MSGSGEGIIQIAKCLWIKFIWENVLALCAHCVNDLILNLYDMTNLKTW